MRKTLPQDRAVKLSKAKVHVYSDSVLCHGKIHEHPRSIEAWKRKSNGSSNVLKIVNWTESKENQPSSSGKIVPGNPRDEGREQDPT